MKKIILSIFGLMVAIFLAAGSYSDNSSNSSYDYNSSSSYTSFSVTNKSVGFTETIMLTYKPENDYVDLKISYKNNLGDSGTEYEKHFIDEKKGDIIVTKKDTRQKTQGEYYIINLTSKSILYKSVLGDSIYK